MPFISKLLGKLWFKVALVSVVLVLIAGNALYIDHLKTKIDKQKVQISQYEQVHAQDKATILSLQALVKSQTDVLEYFDILDDKIKEGLLEVKDDIISEIPEGARSAECGVPRQLVCRSIQTVRDNSGLSATHLDCTTM